MKITYGLNARDVRAFSKKADRKIGFDSSLLEDERDSDFLSTINDRMRMKNQAFLFLQERTCVFSVKICSLGPRNSSSKM